MPTTKHGIEHAQHLLRSKALAARQHKTSRVAKFPGTVLSVCALLLTSTQLCLAQAGPQHTPTAKADAFSLNTLFEPTFVGLSVTPSPSITTVTRNRGHFDFGEVSLLDASVVPLTFGVKNVSLSKIVISRILPSCGCTSVSIGHKEIRGPVAAGAHSLGIVVEPGETVDVAASLSIKSLEPGKIAKSISVYAERCPAVVAIVDITGLLRPGVTFNPPFIDFGIILAGETCTLPVAATFDRRLLVGGRPPVLKCASPGVVVTALDADVTRTKIASRANSRDGALGLADVEYRITVAKTAPIGPISSRIQFSTVPSGGEAVNSALMRCALIITGTIRGGLEVSPYGVAFGEISKGRIAARTVTLFAIAPYMFDRLNIETDSPYIRARLDGSGTHPAVETEAVGCTVSANLIISVDFGDGSGPVVGHVRVTAADGQYLYFPVSAYAD